jgi:hypothetical protein
MKENGSEVFYEILGKERGTKELYHAEDEEDLRGRAFFSCAGTWWLCRNSRWKWEGREFSQ